MQVLAANLGQPAPGRNPQPDCLLVLLAMGLVIVSGTKSAFSPQLLSMMLNMLCWLVKFFILPNG
jgi:hypothetical protein